MLSRQRSDQQLVKKPQQLLEIRKECARVLLFIHVVSTPNDASLVSVSRPLRVTWSSLPLLAKTAKATCAALHISGNQTIHTHIITLRRHPYTRQAVFKNYARPTAKTSKSFKRGAEGLKLGGLAEIQLVLTGGRKLFQCLKLEAPVLLNYRMYFEGRCGPDA